MATGTEARPTVLIADPDAESRRALAETLGGRFTISYAGSLAEASRALARTLPAVLLIELDQPDGDALPLIARLREMPESSRLVIGIITNRSSLRDKLSGFAAGADDFMVKPVNLKRFPHRIVLLTHTRQLAG